MAVLVNLASQAYSVGTHAFPVTVATGASLEVDLTCAGWPTGDVVSASVIWSDGSGGTVVAMGGGKNRDGTDKTVFRAVIGKPIGVTQGNVTVGVLQALTTAITVTSA